MSVCFQKHSALLLKLQALFTRRCGVRSVTYEGCHAMFGGEAVQRRKVGRNVEGVGCARRRTGPEDLPGAASRQRPSHRRGGVLLAASGYHEQKSARRSTGGISSEPICNASHLLLRPVMARGFGDFEVARLRQEVAIRAVPLNPTRWLSREPQWNCFKQCPRRVTSY